MIDLVKLAGLDIKFDEQRYRLVFDKDPQEIQPAIRTISGMKEVLADAGINKPQELYFMYRDVYRMQDRDLIRKYKLRFDITVIKPDILGREFMKTAGHYHPKNYPELYEVVYGEALCLQQRPEEKDFTKIKEVIVVKAKQGQKIICLPYFGHILINTGNTPLITSNWVSSEFSSEYKLYKDARGAAYYAFCEKGNILWQKNNFFKQVPKITFVAPNDGISGFGLKTSIPMYSLVNKLDSLDFLNNPGSYKYTNAFKK